MGAMGQNGGPAEAVALPRLLVPVAAGVAIGIDALFAGLLLVRAPMADPAALTQNGAHNLRPERDAIVYFAAAALAVGASGLLSRPRRRRGPAPPDGDSRRPWLPICVPPAALVLSTGAFLAVRDSAPLAGGAAFAYLAGSVVLAAVCAAAARAAPGGPGSPWRTALDVPARRHRWGAADLVVPALVVALLYVPGWRELAGDAVAGEGALHLDFFGLGPSLAYKSGLALGGEVHPYYGVGWALVFGRLDLLSYGHLMRFEILYGCVYFSAVYVLVRLLTGDRRWAAAGTALAVLFQLFARWPAEFTLWRFPSATVLRWPFDVWFFLACLAGLRSRRPGWGVAATALVGLTVVFQTETALALGLALAFWWAARWRDEGPGALRALPAAAVAAGAVVVVGLGTASRWTLVSGDFVRGWLENVRLGVRGATLLPIVDLPWVADVIAFVVIVVTYLAFASFAVVQVARRQATTAAVMLGSIALYGIVTLLYFVGRSNPNNLYRSTVPLAILLAAGGGLAWRAWTEGRSTPARPAVFLPWAAVTAAVVALAAVPSVRAYPGLIRSAVTDEPVSGDCLIDEPRDVCGLPPQFRGVSVPVLHDVASRLRELGSEGTPLAVIDEIGPVIPYLAGAEPWGRYSPLFPTLFTREQRRAVLAVLEDRPPPLLVMRAREGVEPFYADSWQAFRPAVERRFVLDSRHGSLEIWRRSPR